MITARFEGNFCPADCGSRIHTGDLIELVDGEWVHADCVPDEKQRPRCRACGQEECRC